MSDIEKISDKSKFPTDKREVEKKEIDPKKFRRYVDKVSETDPEEQKRRKLPGEDDPYAQKSDITQSKGPIQRRWENEDEERTDYSKKSGGQGGKDRTFASKKSSQSSSSKEEQEAQGAQKKGSIKGESIEEILSPLEIAAIKKEKKQEALSTKEKEKLRKEALKKIEQETQEKTEGLKKETKKQEPSTSINQKKAEEEEKTISETTRSQTEKISAAQLYKHSKDKKVEESKKSEEKQIKEELQKSQLEGIEIPKIATPESFQAPSPTEMHHIPALQNPQILKMFSHMVSQITMVVQRGETDVTITLGGTAFQNSVFAGTQIVIKQSPSAPNTYNVELYGATNEAQTLFDNHAEELLDAFQSNQYPFKIQRVTTSKTKRKEHMIERKKEKGDGGM
jgi:hypothetical protein